MSSSPPGPGRRPAGAPPGHGPRPSGRAPAPRSLRPLPLPPRQQRFARRVYTIALALYPPAFRRRFAPDLTAAFLDLLAEARLRAGFAGLSVAWGRALADVVAEAAKERLAPLRGVAAPPESAPPGGLQMWDDLKQDVRLVLRALRQAPGYAAAAILTLALGIGANSAIFSLGSAALLQTAPVRSPETLVAVWTTCRAGDPRCSSSYPDYLDYRDRSALLEDLAGYAFTRANLRGEGGARLLSVQASTGNYFELLGVDMAVGRAFTPEDERERRLVAVLTEGLWHDQFGGDPDVVGRRIRLNEATFEVIGVAAAGFHGLHLGDGPELFIPLLGGPALGTGFLEDDSRFSERGSRWISQLIGRLEDGATVEQARAELLAISDQLAVEDPEARGPRRVTVESARHLIGPAADSGELAGFVWLLAGVVGFTLLLACANLANLLLARASARRRELGVRLALGATRTRIIRQMLTESVVLALIGGAAGLLIGAWLLSLLRGYQLPGGVSIAGIDAELDALALLFTAGLAVLTGIAFGMAPAWQATRADLDAGMRAAGRGVVSGGGKLRGALVAVQLALCLVLLTGAGLFLQALRNGLDTDLGFPVEGLAVAAVDLGVLQYGPEQGREFADTLVQRLQALPGVTAAGIGTRAPMLPGGTATLLHSVEGYQPGADEELRLEYTFVSDGYLRALGLPLLQGAGFTGDEAPGSRPMIINRDMAERWWPARTASGGRVYFFGEEGAAGAPGDIVGVVEDTKWDDGIAAADYPFAYLPLTASESWVSGRVVILARTAGDARALLPALRAELAAVEPDASITTLSTMAALLDDVLMPQHMFARLFGWFAGLSLVLAAIGIYSVMAYTVSRRRRDIGVRMALGATRWDIVMLVLGGIAVPLAAGLAGGLGIARLLAGTISGFLYGVSATDPGTIAAVSGGLVAVALLAGLLPARRATQVDPTVSLQAD